MLWRNRNQLQPPRARLLSFARDANQLTAKGSAIAPKVGSTLLLQELREGRHGFMVGSNVQNSP